MKEAKNDAIISSIKENTISGNRPKLSNNQILKIKARMEVIESRLSELENLLNSIEDYQKLNAIQEEKELLECEYFDLLSKIE